MPDEFLGRCLWTKRSYAMSCNIFLSLTQAFPLVFRFGILRGLYGNEIKVDHFNLPRYAQALAYIEINTWARNCAQK